MNSVLDTTSLRCVEKYNHQSRQMSIQVSAADINSTAKLEVLGIGLPRELLNEGKESDKGQSSSKPILKEQVEEKELACC